MIEKTSDSLGVVDLKNSAENMGLLKKIQRQKSLSSEVEELREAVNTHTVEWLKEHHKD